jgi:hypothetical protein
MKPVPGTGEAVQKLLPSAARHDPDCAAFWTRRQTELRLVTSRSPLAIVSSLAQRGGLT